MALEFTFVPPIHISGIEPESVIVGNKFEMSGSGYALLPVVLLKPL